MISHPLEASGRSRSLGSRKAHVEVTTGVATGAAQRRKL